MPNRLRVVMVCADEVLLSLNRVILINSTRDSRSRPIKIESAQTAAQFDLLRASGPIDRVLIFRTELSDEANRIFESLDESGIPTVLVDTVYPSQPRTEEWLMLFQACNQKRGPKTRKKAA